MKSLKLTIINIVFFSLLSQAHSVSTDSLPLHNHPPHIKKLIQAAESGNPKAQFLLGRLHQYGQAKTIPKDYKKSIYWYNRAAAQDHKQSMNKLGMFYAGGIGVKRDCGKAISLFEKVADTLESAKGNMAWVMSTCPESEFRNGKRALKITLELVALSNREYPNELDNLAAAYAETRQFDKAIKTQEEAIKILNQTKYPKKLIRYRTRLESYRNNKPWRGASYAKPF